MRWETSRCRIGDDDRRCAKDAGILAAFDKREPSFDMLFKPFLKFRSPVYLDKNRESFAIRNPLKVQPRVRHHRFTRSLAQVALNVIAEPYLSQGVVGTV